MRRATCISDLTVSVLGSRESMAIGPGAVVDLDLVVGDREGRPETLADALGPLVAHFREDAPAAPRRGRTSAPVTDTPERGEE